MLSLTRSHHRHYQLASIRDGPLHVYQARRELRGKSGMHTLTINIPNTTTNDRLLRCDRPPFSWEGVLIIQIDVVDGATPNDKRLVIHRSLLCSSLPNLQAMHIFINHKLVDDCTVVDRALGRQQLKRTTFFSSRIKSMAVDGFYCCTPMDPFRIGLLLL